MYYKTEQITENSWQISSAEMTNSQLIVGREKALLFDTGYGYGPLYETVRALTTLPLILVNSHGHLDHINGNHQFEGPAYIHEKDAALAREHSSAGKRKLNVESARKNVDRVTGEISDILPVGFDENAYINAKLPKFVFIKEGECFDLGGTVLEVLELPGHTKGSIGLWDAVGKNLYAGDAFGPFTWLFAKEASSLSVYRSSLKKAYSLKPERIFGGHEERPITMETLETYIEVAENPDFEHGMPWKPPILEPTEGDIRICVRPGFIPFQFDKAGYASIVISRENLK